MARPGKPKPKPTEPNPELEKLLEDIWVAAEPKIDKMTDQKRAELTATLRKLANECPESSETH